MRAELNVSRVTATKYLEELVRIGVVSKTRLHRDNFYLNDELFSLLMNANQEIASRAKSEDIALKSRTP